MRLKFWKNRWLKANLPRTNKKLIKKRRRKVRWSIFWSKLKIDKLKSLNSRSISNLFRDKCKFRKKKSRRQQFIKPLTNRKKKNRWRARCNFCWRRSKREKRKQVRLKTMCLFLKKKLRNKRKWDNLLKRHIKPLEFKTKN